MFALRAHGHGLGIELFELSSDKAQRGIARALTTVANPSATLTAPPPSAQLRERTLDVSTTARALLRVEVALSAHVNVRARAAPRDQLALRPLSISNDDQVLVVRSCQGNACVQRSFVGYENNLDAPARVPLELAWQSLQELLVTTPARTAEVNSAGLLAAMWSSVSDLPGWARARMLGLAASLPSPAFVEELIRALDADESTAILAINALATATGQDLRRGATGDLRLPAAIAADYKARAAHAKPP